MMSAWSTQLECSRTTRAVQRKPGLNNNNNNKTKKRKRKQAKWKLIETELSLSVCVGVLPACMSLRHVYVCCPGFQKRWETLKREPQSVVSLHVGAGTHTRDTTPGTVIGAFTVSYL